MKVDEIHDLEGAGLTGWLIYGEPDVTDVELFLADMAREYGDYGPFEGAAENGWDVEPTYVRKVPHHDGYGYGQMKYVYQSKPGPGASQCVRVEPFSSWNRWCVNHAYERAQVGVPVVNVIDPEWPRVIDGYVHLCRACSSLYHARTDLARSERMAEWYATQPGEHYARYAERARSGLPGLRERVADAKARVVAMDAT